MASRRGRAAATGFLKDFQTFIIQGNVVDLAVAVIIGGAFGKIVESLIGDIITPAILKPALEAAKVEDLAKLSAGGILYGKFLAAVINFLVIAFVIFLVIRALEKFKRQEAAAEEAAAAPDPVLESQERLTSTMERLASALENRGV
ncbi:large conductance mechanosensitive channel protein MscL [Pseudanabaena sp. PCC 6802]|uniref:large conductance mechanosensitive channel protein MscL n=1 Tax=Pseudanabaena sp. PCC 6802 TaxID=118173 RepID=UPI0003471FCA|nr:large conductance mechanosensitive channel protein MscL [Pseudanabaena sp. PCC 6802]